MFLVCLADVNEIKIVEQKPSSEDIENQHHLKSYLKVLYRHTQISSMVQLKSPETTLLKEHLR